ncbi:MAG: transcriptional repressor [Phycisphaerales bacterium]|nr:transcriptional repressor [Phycisphaerales bacterium]
MAQSPESRADSTPAAIPGGIEVLAPLCSVFRRFLKERNLRYTQERADVLDAVMAQDGLFEAEGLLAQLRSRTSHNVSKATVYRTLRLLQEAGIITPTLVDPKQTHFQLVYGREPADLLICMETQQHVSLRDPEITQLRDAIAKRHGWRVTGHRFVIYGLSPEAGEPGTNMRPDPSSA